MTEPFFPPPLIDTLQLNPLERLRVYDSLMIDAERWQKAHNYHRQRQNVYYQALNQPGIVHGLGVQKIDPPKEVAAQFRLQPWLRIQPGVAIDWEGNPIIVPQAVNFPLRLPDLVEDNPEPIDLYLVASYRDPENLKRNNTGEVIQETFRLDQKTTAPMKGEVELCRIKWQPHVNEINVPQDVLFPSLNELDLRHRLTVKNRAWGTLNVSVKDTLDSRSQENLAHLMASIAALYPNFKGLKEPNKVILRTIDTLANCDLFFIPSNDVEGLDSKEVEVLKQYLAKGGVILFEVAGEHNIINAGDLISRKFSFNSWTWQRDLDRNHPLRTEPFVFAMLPEVSRCPIEVWHNNGGIVLVEGELSAAWGFDEELLLSRSEIRAAQEFGINLLHFGWRRRNLNQLLN